MSRPAIFHESPLPDYTHWIEFSADDFIILNDVESPGYDHKVLNMVYHMGNEFGIKHLVLGGDFIANDSWSKWAKMTQNNIPFRKELRPTIEIVNTFSKVFSAIKWITGNHERRFAYHCDGEYTIGDIVQQETDAEFSEYAHCYVHSAGRKIMVVHQDNYSKVPLSIPYEIASTELCDVACTHTHRLALGWDRSNTFQIAECGHGRSVPKTHYIQLRKNRMPKWNSGFLLVKNGIFQGVNQYNFEEVMERGITVKTLPYPPEVLEMAEKLLRIQKGDANVKRSESA